ncbi:unnamed protein product [Thlaspi arvense]|uniref:RCK N-terminal domain-containing protein n=1 Tax=Thlaspi arvense TaxID=13288 RepID=A0AAU9RJ96_THLAR|nr:unnamed protein product [Thlaspi arvense]
MDFACSLQRSTVCHGVEFTSSRKSDSLRSNMSSNSRGIGCNFLGNPRVFSAYRITKLKKIIVSRTNRSIHSCITFKGDFDSHFQVCKSLGSLKNYNLVNVVKTSRGIFGLRCQGNDSIAFINGNDRNVELVEGHNEETAINSELNGSRGEIWEGEEDKEPSLEELRDKLQKALEELEVARLNSSMFEEKAQKISETAIALKDEEATARDNVNSTLDIMQEIMDEETVATEAVQRATVALSLAEARLQVAMESLESAKGKSDSLRASGDNDLAYESGGKELKTPRKEEEPVLVAQDDIRECQATLADCETELRRLQSRRDELQKEVDRLNEVAERAQMDVFRAEEDVANVMLLAEQAVAFELEAAQRISDVEIALQKAEKDLSISLTDSAETTVLQNGSSSMGQSLGEEELVEEGKVSQGNSSDAVSERDTNVLIDSASIVLDPFPACRFDGPSQRSEEPKLSYDSDKESGKVNLELKDPEVDTERSKNLAQTKKQELQKDLMRDGSASNAPKASLKKSSRFFSASFFSLDGTEFTPASIFHGLIEHARKHLPKLVVGSLLVGAGVAVYVNHKERISQLYMQPDIITTSIDEVNEEEASLFDMLWLLLASVIFVPIFQKIPGGSPVLGYLAAGILIGPYGLSIIRHVHGTKAIAEFGVVFLLFNIGLELSVERLSSMKKYVFGLGSAQVLVTAVVVGLVAHFIAGQPGPAAIVIGNGLALSSTAVVLQVLQERGESTSRHGRATFSVLLFQDLAVVVLLILIPLISPNSSKGGVGFQAIAEALGLAAVKAIAAIAAIIAGGRLLLRPIYKQIAENQNAEIFSANTLFVILGTSLLTARAGLSMALGAFLAGLLLAETEFSLQVESDIAPYRGLLLGLFFMTVGMSIDPKLFVSNFPVISGTLALLLVGKTILVAVVGRLFGYNVFSTVISALPCGRDFNGSHPWLAAGGQLIASRFELHDVRSLLPVESEIIAQLLSERLIPFVALDVRSDRVAIGRALDLPVYFGDAGSREVLHKVGAERACAAAITLDTPGANYRTVWALNKYFPNVKTFVRAHDVDHGLNLEKAGATAVVPETLEPSLQLAAAVLAQAKLPMSEIAATINEFRSRHLSELTELSEASGSSLGYGFSSMMSKPKLQPLDSSDENQMSEGTLAI